MKDTQKKIINYCEALSTPQSAVLYNLERETYLKTLAPQMISGHLQGQLLQFISQMIKPKYVLEIGTFTGYAAICLAKGLQEGGQLHTIEVKPELGYLSQKYVEKAGLKNQIYLHTGKAEEIIPTLNLEFDIVFIDAGKNDYARHYDMVIELLKPGGIILADNVLWSGKVVQEKYDTDTTTIHNFNQKVQDDSRVENLILPLRDGLLIARKLGY